MECLVVTVLGENSTGIADKLTHAAAQSKCNIIDCKMFVLGNEFTAHLLVGGNWNAIAKMESNLDLLEKKEELQILKQRTKSIAYPKDILPYIVYVVAKDQQGMLNKLSSFFAEQQINITELICETRPARKSGAMIMSLTMCINIPIEFNIADLRERFIIFCDSYNLDGVMEAEKGI